MVAIRNQYWKMTPLAWLMVLAASVIVGAIFYDGLSVMAQRWHDKQEYSHGFLIPLITIYLIWQRSDRLRATPFTGSWFGVFVACAGIGLYFIGDLSTIYALVQYAFVVVVFGVTWAFLGTNAFRIAAVPMLLLFFMVPFPAFIHNNLSSQLQLISSEIGVAVIRLFGISVFLEGNVIDLGTYKLQVVEACNGLRYLFPLMTLGLIVAYLYHAALWKRVFVFLSTIPITILMNSFRIGVIGVLVEHWGQSMAEGFLHDFEGWVIFMACFGILFVEMWLLMRLTNDRRPLREVFGIDPPEPIPSESTRAARRLPVSFLAMLAFLVAATIPALTVPDRVEIPPPRESFATFPLQIGEWQGRSERLEQIFLDALKLTDYSLINYADPSGHRVNFYSAYYESQRKGQSAHSPRSCIPGGGWRIESLDQRTVPGSANGGKGFEVNRAVISNGDHRQLVYYWFQQRGRFITNEYLVKWFMFWDALTKNRTDGSLVRLTIPVGPGQSVQALEKVLQSFVAKLEPILPKYIPD